MKEKLEAILKTAPRVRKQFEVEVEQAAIEVVKMAKQISPAIGEISITEAKSAIIREFAERLTK